MKLYTLDEQFIKEIFWVPEETVGFTGIAKTDSNMAEWFQNGKRHRDDDLPAIIIPGICKQWFLNGLRHRINGPAVVWENNTTEYYYIYGETCTKEQHTLLVNVIKLKGLL